MMMAAPAMVVVPVRALSTNFTRTAGPSADAFAYTWPTCVLITHARPCLSARTSGIAMRYTISESHRLCAVCLVPCSEPSCAMCCWCFVRLERGVGERERWHVLTEPVACARASVCVRAGVRAA